MDTILAMDIGTKTQDILLFQRGGVMENNIQLVLPSPTQLIGQRIRRCTQARKPLYLGGTIMGGGPCLGALKEHLAQGLPAYATPQGARTFDDDLEKVKAMGVQIVEKVPEDSITLGDLDLETFSRFCELYQLEKPDEILVAVQDHGYDGGSDRVFRFQLWRHFIEGGGHLRDLLLEKAPAYLTRMAAIQETHPQVKVMDTSGAAIWGALCDPLVRQAMVTTGCTIVNIGNGHTMGALVWNYRIWGLFEHHTGLLTPQKLKEYVQQLQRGTISNEEVYASGGHGAFIHRERPDLSFEYIAVTGPQRHLGADYYFANPYGNMMLADCFGLIAGAGYLPLEAKTNP
ncbi:MAG: DUF1786 domain-containing protein [Limnochordia bacterium]|jgi:uncharacterized protein (DUF1786 family)